MVKVRGRQGRSRSAIVASVVPTSAAGGGSLHGFSPWDGWGDYRGGGHDAELDLDPSLATVPKSAHTPADAVVGALEHQGAVEVGSVALGLMVTGGEVEGAVHAHPPASCSGFPSGLTEAATNFASGNCGCWNQALVATFVVRPSGPGRRSRSISSRPWRPRAWPDRRRAWREALKRPSAGTFICFRDEGQRAFRPPGTGCIRGLRGRCRDEQRGEREDAALRWNITCLRLRGGERRNACAPAHGVLVDEMVFQRRAQVGEDKAGQGEVEHFVDLLQQVAERLVLATKVGQRQHAEPTV